MPKVTTNLRSMRRMIFFCSASENSVILASLESSDATRSAYSSSFFSASDTIVGDARKVAIVGDGVGESDYEIEDTLE